MLPPPFDRLAPDETHASAFGSGDVIFRQGDPARGMYCVENGSVELRRHTEAGATVILHRAVTGETLAEASLFSESYHCDGVVTRPSRLVRLDKAAILRHLVKDPEFAAALLARLAGQVQHYRRRLELLAIRGAEDRVFAALADGFAASPVVSLAATLGLTPEATYRALSALAARGAVRREGRGRYRIVTPG